MIAPRPLSTFAERAGPVVSSTCPRDVFVSACSRDGFGVVAFVCLAVRERLRALGVALGRLLRLNLVVIMRMPLPVGGRVCAKGFNSTGRPMPTILRGIAVVIFGIACARTNARLHTQCSVAPCICGSRPSPSSVQGNLREGRCLRVAVPDGGPGLRSSNGVGGSGEGSAPAGRAPRAGEARVGARSRQG